MGKAPRGQGHRDHYRLRADDADRHEERRLSRVALRQFLSDERQHRRVRKMKSTTEMVKIKSDRFVSNSNNLLPARSLLTSPGSQPRERSKSISLLRIKKIATIVTAQKTGRKR